MSVDKGRLDQDAASKYETFEKNTDKNGIFARLKRHFEVWSRLYVEQRVAARTGRNH
jgi:hypothetical protein